MPSSFSVTDVQCALPVLPTEGTNPIQENEGAAHSTSKIIHLVDSAQSTSRLPDGCHDGLPVIIHISST